MKKGCKNCKYAEWARTEKGNIRRSVAGTCKYKVIPPVLPDSIGKFALDQIAHCMCPTGIWVGDGQNCRCFEAKK